VTEFEDALLPGLPAALIRAAYEAAPGNEIKSGKFLSPESSAALAANAFGFFLDRVGDLPPLPGTSELAWPASSVSLEAIVRFPWAGGSHPCLDALIQTRDAIIGVESKRFEPFRSKGVPSLSEAYWRPVWGADMRRYETMRDEIRSGAISYAHLDAVQLVKHAFGLRTAGEACGHKAVLVYLFTEPVSWPDGRGVPASAVAQHRSEIADFAARVAGDQVRFVSCAYRELLETWRNCANDAVRRHAGAIVARFSP
jgi:hypothetical protein